MSEGTVDLETIKNTIISAIKNYDGNAYEQGYISAMDDIRWAIEGTKEGWNRRSWFDLEGKLVKEKLAKEIIEAME